MKNPLDLNRISKQYKSIEEKKRKLFFFVFHLSLKRRKRCQKEFIQWCEKRKKKKLFNVHVLYFLLHWIRPFDDKRVFFFFLLKNNGIKKKNFCSKSKDIIFWRRNGELMINECVFLNFPINNFVLNFGAIQTKR